jgi:hypothetical protein
MYGSVIAIPRLDGTVLQTPGARLGGFFFAALSDVEEPQDKLL